MFRAKYCDAIHLLFQVNPIVAILGPRQCGKTTLAEQYAQHKVIQGEQIHRFDLELPLDLQKLESPQLALQNLTGLIVIDEIQLRPNLFPILRYLIDHNRGKQRYLILGSASRELIKQSSETLAGRISYLELTPFDRTEVDNITNLWERGGYPPSYLANDQQLSYLWRESYIKTFLEQDIAMLGFNIPPEQLRRFWIMLTHYHGQIFNANEIGNSLDLNHKTIRKYLDILTGTFMIRELKPWHSNIKKRQVKSSKIYFRDSGILHALMRVQTLDELYTNPKLGASWEGFALEEVIRQHGMQIDQYDCYFWATNSGAELDLLIRIGGKHYGFEFKYTDTPKTTKSMHIAVEDLQLEKLTIIYPGADNFSLTDKISACGLQSYEVIT